MLQQNDSKCYKRLGRAFILQGFYTEVLVPLKELSSGVSQRRLFRYYLVIVSMAVVCRVSSLSYCRFWAGGFLQRVTTAKRETRCFPPTCVRAFL